MQTLHTTINYGDRLMALRQSKGWTRERLASGIHASCSTVTRLELNQTTLTPSRAEAIARAYGLQVIEFWEWMCC